VDLRRHRADRRRRKAATSSAPRRLLRRRRRLHRRRIVSVRTRRESGKPIGRSARRPGQRHPGCDQGAVSDVTRRSSWATVHDRAAVPQWRHLHRSSPSESHIPGATARVDARPAGPLALQTIRRTDETRGGSSPGRPGSGGDAQRGVSGRTPSSILARLDLCRGRQSVRRELEADRHQPIHRFDSGAVARQRRAEMALQQVHHDVWDYDSGNQPSCSTCRCAGGGEGTRRGEQDGYLYILDRETGTPVHPITGKRRLPTETATGGRAAVARRSRFRTPRPGSDETGIAGVSDRRARSGS